MQMRSVVPVVLLVLSAGLAGCAGKESKALSEETVAPLVPGDADWGALEGLVYNAEVLPQPDVTVRLVGTEIATLTDALGYYLFLELAPGNYQVQINESGFLPIHRNVSIGAGVGLRLDFTLREIPNKVPFIDDSFVRRGQIHCQLRANASGTNTNPSCSDVAEPVTGPYLPPGRGANISLLAGAEGMLIEVKWTPSTPQVNNRLRLAIRSIEGESWRQVEGESVLRVELNAAAMADFSRYAQRDYYDSGGLVHFLLFPGEAASTGMGGAGGTFYQDYTMYVTVFYRQPLVPGYTRIVGN